MRKSSTMILLILLIAFGGMLFAADMFVLQPVRNDLAVVREIEGLLGPAGRDWIVVSRETPTKLRTGPGGGDRLVQDNRIGVAVEVHPTQEALLARGRPGALVNLIAETIVAKAEGESPIQWIEVILRYGEGPALFKTLIERGPAGGAWLAPNPVVPASWTEEALERASVGMGG